MMHSMGIHSALAIKRQRKRRTEARRAKERRHSVQSNDSGYNNSTGSLDTNKPRAKRPSLNTEGQTVTSIGMLHIGVVFLVLGTFLLASGILPDDLTNWQNVFKGGWFNELVLSGTFALAIGVFLIVLNKIIAKKEDDDLSEYVARQLTRTKSGQRLVRDVETGCLSTKNERRQKVHDEVATMDHLPQIHSPKHVDVQVDKRTHLELIAEEEYSEKGEEESRCASKESCGESLSPSSPSETRELLAQAERYFSMAKK